MSNVDRLTRVNALLKREIAESLYRVFAGKDFDFAAVTVTHVFISSDLHTARVLVSILGHEKDRAGILRQLQQYHGPIQKLLSKHVILKYTPQLHFELDTSDEQGDHILRILEKMEGEHHDWANEPPPAPPKEEETPSVFTPAAPGNPRANLIRGTASCWWTSPVARPRTTWWIVSAAHSASARWAMAVRSTRWRPAC